MPTVNADSDDDDDDVFYECVAFANAQDIPDSQGGEEGPSDVVPVSREHHETIYNRFRPRRRSSWMRALQALFQLDFPTLVAVLRGRWDQTLPAWAETSERAVLAAWVGFGVRVVGQTTIASRGGFGETAKEFVSTLLLIEDGEGNKHLVYPELLAKLACFAAFRQRDAALLQTLKFRALDWFKDRNIPWADALLGLHSTVVFGAAVSSLEHDARDWASKWVPGLGTVRS
jgi:hypothetical protein